MRLKQWSLSFIGRALPALGRISTVSALAAASLAFAPSVYAQQQRTLSASDVQQAEQEHPKVLAEFGGAMEGPLANYVAGVGSKVAVQTGLPASAYRVTVLNSPILNAFAMPGGYVYISRGLLALMNSEDELAFVLGHEMGHVAARHGQKRQSRQVVGSIGAVLAQVLTGSNVLGQLAGQVGQGLLLGYSRSQENEADTLGVRYIAAAHYDPFAAPRMLSAMGAAESLQAHIAGQGERQSSWWSTHPLSSTRVKATQTLAGKLASGARATDNSRFFTAIDKMAYSDDPKQGVIEGNRFLHPELRFGFTAPSGYTITNGASSVTISGQGGVGQFSMARLSGGLDGLVSDVFRQLAGGKTVPRYTLRTMSVNGLPVAYGTTSDLTSSGKRIDVSVVAYKWDSDTAYYFMLQAPSGSGFGPFASMVQSLHRLSATEVSGIRGRVIRIVTVANGDTVQSLARRMAFPDYQLERFLVLNGLSSNSSLVPGSRVKLVEYGA